MTRFIIPGLILAFSIYCLIDVVRSENSDVRGLPKLVWVLLVLLFPLAGGIAWFVAGRPRGSVPLGVDRLSRRKPGPVVLGPDDDPDFLRSINRVDPAEPVDGVGPATGTTTSDPGSPSASSETSETDDPGDPAAGDRRP